VRIWFLVIMVMSLAFPASAQVISGIKIDDAGVTFAIHGLDSVSEAPVIFAIDGEKPRIVVDFHDATLQIEEYSLKNGPQTIAGSSGVKNIRIAQQNKSGIRVVLDLAAGVSMTRHEIRNGQIFVSLSGTAPIRQDKPVSDGVEREVQRAAPRSGPRYFTDKTPYPRLAPHFRKPVRKPVIVIDPGHGGKDPGAIGIKGTKEKDITHKAALELQKQLIATGRYSVIVTRSKDIYIDHEERLRIARAGNADLFISIHADSTKGSTARGASVYTLADRAKKRSKNIVNSQNWILDVDLSEQSDPVGDILVDLAQRKTESQSEMFANMLVSDLGKSTRLIGNSHRRAGYFVLLAPDVPAVLLELGFLSNPQDEKLLKTKAHRKKVLTAVTRSINTYFSRQKS